MNYYPHHIGDFRGGTYNMSRLERWIYRDMLEVYYDTEQPLPGNLDELCNTLGARDRQERDIVVRLLAWKFKLVDGRYVHERAEHEIKVYQGKAEIARENGKKGGRPARVKPGPNAELDLRGGAAGAGQQANGNPPGSDSDAKGNPQQTGSQTNHEPRTINQNQTNPPAPPTLSEEGGRGVTPVELSDEFHKHGVHAQAADPRVLALARQGVAVATVKAACNEAKKSKTGESIVLGYVVAILERWAAQAEAITVRGARPPELAAAANGSAKDQVRRTTLEGLTGRKGNDPRIIDLN